MYVVVILLSAIWTIDIGFIVKFVLIYVAMNERN